MLIGVLGTINEKKMQLAKKKVELTKQFSIQF